MDIPSKNNRPKRSFDRPMRTPTRPLVLHALQHKRKKLKKRLCDSVDKASLFSGCFATTAFLPSGHRRPRQRQIPPTATNTRSLRWKREGSFTAMPLSPSRFLQKCYEGLKAGIMASEIHAYCSLSGFPLQDSNRSWGTTEIVAFGISPQRHPLLYSSLLVVPLKRFSQAVGTDSNANCYVITCQVT